jgi:hypothetical protein
MKVGGLGSGWFILANLSHRRGMGHGDVTWPIGTWVNLRVDSNVSVGHFASVFRTEIYISL